MPIKPLSAGPLLVSDAPTLRTSAGEPVAVNEPYALCRCGASKNKPFCDGRHKEIGYSDTREIDTENHRSKAYTGEAVTVQDNRTICAHAGHCIKELPSVFDAKGRPWVRPDEASQEEVVALAQRCPSGALTAYVNGERIDRQDLPVQITILEDGPYRVDGALAIECDDELLPPVADRYVLCRCGASKNKPYCDGSHLKLEAGWGALAGE